ncbi:MFS transporter [Basilea psittacipulmonis]|uniref:Major facilitator transporter n=1 Tax=Basilea psittacipulmonis DSM 24701 TaxID=1072685 RepID=A0A077DH80_9BURK|nr:nitrate/nitrite transporter [Basilea psittacipulmonis]AIL32822.1 major facilitator transporter [Basilea psittacipulmonis DSM 24701]
MVSEQYKRYSVLISSTFAFTVCFMIWVMFAVLAIPIKEQLNLTHTQFGLLTSIPILSGSLVRVPLGILTDKYGGRIVFFLLMLISVPFIFLVTYAYEYWHFVVIGLFLGLAGGSFSVGTPYVARWFPKSQQGLAMGIFGAGNAGSALTKLLAPSLIAIGTWHLVPQVYAALMFGTAILFWFLTYSKKEHLVSSKVDLKQQIALLADPGVLRYSQLYSVVFGGYVALALWMVEYYVEEYHLSLGVAAFLAACFSLPGGVLRAFGGYLSDRFGAYKVTWGVMWVCWVCFFILSYPHTDFVIHTTKGDVSLSIQLNVVVFTILMFIVGVAMAIGKASVFKFVANDYPDNIGAVSGVVGLAGGLGGFILPIMFGIALDVTGIRSTTFMLLYGTVCVSLVWMHFSMKKVNKA